MSTKKKKDECGCGHDHAVEDMHTIVITNDDGTEMEFDILGTLDHKSKKYIALLPRNFMVYEYKDKGEGMELIDIEDEKVMEEIGAKFEALLSCEDQEEKK
jgi:uncharacterized protein YrzB (UPF0473 family)